MSAESALEVVPLANVVALVLETVDDVVAVSMVNPSGKIY
jgi:hypothetical protein